MVNKTLQYPKIESNGFGLPSRDLMVLYRNPISALTRLTYTLPKRKPYILGNHSYCIDSAMLSPWLRYVGSAMLSPSFLLKDIIVMRIYISHSVWPESVISLLPIVFVLTTVFQFMMIITTTVDVNFYSMYCVSFHGHYHG